LNEAEADDPGVAGIGGGRTDARDEQGKKQKNAGTEQGPGNHDYPLLGTSFIYLDVAQSGRVAWNWPKAMVSPGNVHVKRR
jgi:hypothetical protein